MTVQPWNVWLSATESLRVTEPADATARFSSVPLILEADLTVDAGLFGSFDVAIAQPLAVTLAGSILEGADRATLRFALQGVAVVDIPRQELFPAAESLQLTVRLEAMDVAMTVPATPETVQGTEGFIDPDGD